MKLWKQRAQRNEYQNLEAYCMRLAKNLSIDKTRAKHQQHVSLEQDLLVEQDLNTPYQQVAQKDLWGHIRKCMQELPEKQRLVMQLRDVEGIYKYMDIDGLEHLESIKK